MTQLNYEFAFGIVFIVIEIAGLVISIIALKKRKGGDSDGFDDNKKTDIHLPE